MKGFRFECKVTYENEENVWHAKTFDEAIRQVKCQLQEPDSILGFVTELDKNWLPKHTTAVTK